MLCDNCHKEPAVYGDGVTWKKCAKCYYLEQKNKPQEEKPAIKEEGEPHKTIPGLTSIIIPVYMLNYPLFHMTGNCIGSVREHTDKKIDPYEIIIIDNGSPVQPPSLNSYYAEKIIKWDKNEGVSKAWNAGIRMSFGEYLVLLNNDTQVYDGWLSKIKEALDGGLDLVMAKPMYSLTEPFARSVEAMREKSRWERLPIAESFDKTGPTDFACVGFKKQLVNEIGIEEKGLFREEFFAYCSDVDLLKRMDQANKKYAVCKAIPIHHIIDATGNNISETPQIMNSDKETFKKLWEKPQPAIGVGQAPLGSTAVAKLSLAVVDEKKVDNLVRTNETGDKLYLIKNNTLHWVKNPQVLEALGLHFGEERTVDKNEFAKYQYGDPIDMINISKYR